MRLGTRIRANNALRLFVRRNREKRSFWRQAARVADMQEARRVFTWPKRVENNYGVRQVQRSLVRDAADRVRRVMRGEYV